ncbi:transglutaminase-like putative cysteine protease [Saccharopolyspora gloriosae]|uniref:Transglutaminase-like putative cysteine protease n=1 Tax=Saccharopolyspora gloriosae TaxID=455344 RepID=A0A840NH51_9PSEU|nr:transglutaminase-like putative cysteine protease [Saccharopolyspora gloriosae]
MSTRVRPASTTAVSTLAAVVATLTASTAFTGILGDGRWIVPAVLAVVVVGGTGLLGRTLRWWTPLIVPAQAAVLAMLLSALFTGQALLGFLPGSGALGELSGLLGQAMTVAREGVPPVPVELPLQVLICLGLGVVALLVDVIAVSAGVPAVAGLVLLCVVAIPASLAPNMLPWWTFVAGAAGFALLLACSGRHRHGSGGREELGRRGVALAAAAGVVSLLTGVVFTGVGTEGRLPGGAATGYGSGTGGIGLRPFTSLRGQLDRDSPVDLFRVRGLPEPTYLRAMTLQHFDPGRGWELGTLNAGVDAREPLPLPTGTNTLAQGPTATVNIDPVGYRDPWLPIFGLPRSVDGMGDQWRYDPGSGVVFTQTRQESRPYVETVTLPSPTPQQLREANGPVDVAPEYLNTDGVSPRIAELSQRLTADAPTDFDKAVALQRFFTDRSNGFRYDLSTGPSTSGNALEDFLFRGKRGFCEQFASSMGVLLRSAGVPARVAVGFTSGYRDGDERVISTNDAHAWVEAYFPQYGWVTFDPTPLADGRTALPEYLNPPAPAPAPTPDSGEQQQPTESTAPQPEAPVPGDAEQAPAPEAPRPGSGGAWVATGLVLLAALLLGMAPAVLREIRRRRRLTAIRADAPGAAGSAWRELLDEFTDRGGAPADTSATVRSTAATIITTHDLDEDAARAVHDLVTAVEREWYAPTGHTTTTMAPPPADTLARALSALQHRSPLTWRQRLLPRSVLPHRPDQQDTTP